MLRYRDYDWKLAPGESRFDVQIGILSEQSKAVTWTLELHYAAAGSRWRRCQHFDRPRFEITVSSFTVPPGDWRNLADVNFWNFQNDDFLSSGPRPGYLDTSFRGRAWDGTGLEFSSLGYLNWRVIEAEKSHFTIELTADAKPPNPHPGPAVMATLGPEFTEEIPPSYEKHDLYLLEAIPFGTVTVRVPRNSPDPASHAETLARRALKTPPADYIEIMDLITSDNDGLRSDLFVKLHFFGLYDG